MGEKISETYEKISYALKFALDKLGVESDFALPEKKSCLSSPSCFATYSVREILCQGYKISGSAQFREEEVVIQHGNILFKSSEKRLSDLFHFEKSKNLDRINGLGIYEILGIELEFNAVAEELKKAFGKVFDIDFEEFCMSDDDIANAHKLVLEKYDNLAWTKAS